MKVIRKDDDYLVIKLDDFCSVQVDLLRGAIEFDTGCILTILQLDYINNFIQRITYLYNKIEEHNRDINLEVESFNGLYDQKKEV